MLPPPDPATSATISDDALATYGGTINLDIRSPTGVDKGTIHIETKDGQKFDLPFTVAQNETPAQLAERLANILRDEGFLTDVVGSELTVRARNGDPVTGIGAGVTYNNGDYGKLKPGTTGQTQRLEPVYDSSGKITGWRQYQPSIYDDVVPIAS